MRTPRLRPPTRAVRAAAPRRPEPRTGRAKKPAVRALVCGLAAVSHVAVLPAPAQAHSSLCTKSKPPIVEVSLATLLRGDAAVSCPLGGHETWISASVSVQKDFGSWWNRDWGQVGPSSPTDRMPDVGQSPGTAKSAGAVKRVPCVPGTYRTQISYQVGGPAGTISTRMTSDSRKVSCRT